MNGTPVVKIGINQHWYSQFWIKQFWQLRQQGLIRLRPLLRKRNPYACFYFEVNDRPYLIDVHDKKELWEDPADYAIYFKANYASTILYPENVRPCWNGTTLKRENVPPPAETEREFDVVFISSISGGRYHKVALYEALAQLPIRKKLVLKMVSPDDRSRWGDYVTRLGVEVVDATMPYIEWLAWQKRGRWCVLTRGKHDCLSFKMLDYMSIGAAVLADYAPTSRWPVPLVAGENYVSLEVPHFTGDEMEQPNFDALRHVYAQRARKLMPVLRDEKKRQQVAQTNLDYFHQHIAQGAAARHVLETVQEQRQAQKFTS